MRTDWKIEILFNKVKEKADLGQRFWERVAHG